MRKSNKDADFSMFDDDKNKSWDEKIYSRDETFDGKTIHVIGL